MTEDVGPRTGRTPASPRPRRLPIVMAFLTLIGLAISLYLTVAHYSHEISPVCAENAAIDCAAVTSSEYSEFLGIPLPVLGMGFFVGFGALITPRAWRSEKPILRRGRLCAALAGVVFVVYLVSAELIVLRKICLWCTAVHIVTVLLFGLVVADEYRRIGQTSGALRKVRQ